MFRRRRSSEDFAAEIEAHLQLESERLQDEGVGAGEARAAAHRTFGNVAQAQERFYESRSWVWWDRLTQDVRYALRMLRRSPAFTAVAILTMGLGIGSTTAIFSVVDATLLRPLPFPHPEQLVWIVDDLTGVPSEDVGVSQPELQDLQRSGIFQYVSPAWFDENNLTGSTRPMRVNLDSVAPGYFALLGVAPQIGRTFDPDNHGAGYLPDVVISDGLWKGLFGGDPRVLDKSIRLDTDVYHIVGVMPPGFHAPGRTIQERSVDVWAATNFYGPPLPMQPPRNVRNIPGAMARLNPGLTIASAQSKVDSLVAALRREYAVDYPPQAGWTIRLVPLQERIAGNAQQPLLLLFGAVGLVLLIAAVNVANLLLARASSRARELAIRQALGAARARLTRQLITENVLLSLLGAVAALAILLAMKPLLLRLVPDTLPRLNDISLNRTVWLFALAASLVTGVMFGLIAALHVERLGLAHQLKREGRGSTAAGEQARTRQALVVAEFALSLVLLVAAGLLFRSFRGLLDVQLGFTPDRVMTVRTRLPYPNDITVDRYRTVVQQTPFVRELVRRLRTLPGVAEVAAGNTTAIPLDHAQRDVNQLRVTFEDRRDRDDRPSLIEAAIVTPEYFRLMGITLRRGRLFSDFDTAQVPEVVVVNEAMAATYWPDQDPIGRHVKLSRPTFPWATVVGVVANARTESLANARVPQIYVSLYQYEYGAKHLALFLQGDFDPAAIPDQVRAQVQAVDSTLPVYGAQMVSDTVSASLSVRRFAMELVGLFALTAVLLAGLGIYGVIAYLVTQRSHEIGIRLALGAEPGAIVAGIVTGGLGLAVAGVAVGVVGALVMSRGIAVVLYGVAPTDPLTFAAVAALLVVIALLACYIPARRAVRVDPMIALRAE